jgi:hypothetical protein
MKRLLPVLFLLIVVVLIAIPDSCRAKDEMAKMKRDQNAMNAVIEQFARDNYLCGDQGEELKFAISTYGSDGDPVHLPDENRKTIAACNEKYIVNMERKGIRSAYIYCFDNQVPKLLASNPDPAGNSEGCEK